MNRPRGFQKNNMNLLKSTIKFSLLFLLFPSAVRAQQTYSGIRTLTYGGFGLMAPSSGMKENAMIDNGINFRFGHFQPLTGKKNPSSTAFKHLGLEIRLDYSKFPGKLQAPASVSSIRYNNGGSTPVALQLKLEAKEKKPDAFQYLIGPSAYFAWDRIFVQPSLLFGYASVAQESFRFTETIDPGIYPGQEELVDFYSGTHETNNGFVFNTGLKAGYRLKPCLAAFVSADYSFGSQQDYTDMVFQPMGAPTNGVYDYLQMRNGTQVSAPRQSKMRLLALTLNLAFTLPSRNNK